METDHDRTIPVAGSDDREILPTGSSVAAEESGGLNPSTLPDHIIGNEVNEEGDDNEDDNWSRQVEMDEATTVGFMHEDSFRMESVLEPSQRDATTGSSSVAENMHQNQLSLGSSISGGEGGGHRMNEIPQPPAKPELTMKEKLVLRERQRRIETERARLKRQFALSGTSDANDEEENDCLSRESDTSASGRGGGGGFSLNHSDNMNGGNGDDGTHTIGRDGSIAEGTLGEESTKAHPDHESPAHDEATSLGFNMERFLRNSDSYNPQLEPTEEIIEGGGTNSPPEQGVLMERFLNDPIVVPPIVEENENPEVEHNFLSEERNHLLDNTHGDVILSVRAARVAFDVEAPSEGPGTVPSFGYDLLTNTSLVSSTGTSVHAEVGEIDSVIADDDIAVNAMMSPSMDGQDITSNASDGVGSEQPRVLRLTEADMQEMAAIEEASIGNAPPSEREEEMLSELGELADFGGHHHIGTDNTVSTPTTTMESASQISDSIGYQSHRIAHIAHHHPTSTSSLQDGNDDVSTDHPLLDDLPTLQSISDQLLLSPGGALSNHSVAANPPSIVPSEDEDNIDLMIDDDVNVGGEMEAGGPRIVVDPPPMQLEPPALAEKKAFEHLGGVNEDMINRLHQPDFEGRSPASGIVEISTSRPRGLLPQQHNFTPTIVVNEYDFDKESNLNASYLEQVNNDYIRALNPDNRWSQGSGNANIHRKAVIGPDDTDDKGNIELYGSLETVSYQPDIKDRNGSFLGEQTPLLSKDIPPEIVARCCRKKNSFENGSPHNHSFPPFVAWDATHRRMSFQPQVVAESIFHEVRTHNSFDDVEIHHASEIYNRSSTLQRAFPERQFALIITLMLELPVLLVITGRGDQLCQLIGRRKFNLLIGFIPLTSAISGNVGLQASTLTTRAISHAHVTEKTYLPWLWHEIGVAFYLGCGTGIILGTMAFFTSGNDFSFACTIFIAQVISMLTAGITGTFAPLMFSFVFRRDAGKWSGPLETAIQDIVGSFAMMVISYHFLLWFGERNLDPDDACFNGES